MNWVDKLERKYRGFGITHLMSYIIGGSAIVYLLSLVDPSLVSLLMFDADRILSGEVWRIVTFIFIPPASGILGFLVLFLYYSIGTNLELEWGTFRFNFYYFFGMISIIVSAILIKLFFNINVQMSNYYLNLSLFFAFARLFPDFTLMIYFVLPVKIKYLGWISWGFLGLSLLTGNLGVWISVIFGVLNYFVFFGGDIIRGRQSARRSYARKKEYREENRVSKQKSIHRCTVCNRTEKDDPNLEFRYCSKCNGDHEYCMEHLFTHEHK